MAAAGTWDRDRVLARIRAWAVRFGEPPTVADWDPQLARAAGLIDDRETTWEAEHPAWPSVRTVRMHCGGLGQALLELGLDPGPGLSGTLIERVEVARRLSAHGLRGTQIASYLGVHASTVYAYLRARPCTGCGTPVTGGRSERCRRCALSARAEERWPEGLLVERMREWHRVTGRVPSEMQWRRPRDAAAESRWLREHPHWPPAARVRAVFGSWGEAQRRAGLPTLRHPRTRENVTAWLQQWAQEHPGRSLSHAELEDLARKGDAPWPRSLVVLFGSYSNALRHADLPSVRNVDDAVLVAHARSLPIASGGSLARARWDASSPPLSGQGVARRYAHGWQGFLRAAGLPSSAMTETEMLDAVLEHFHDDAAPTATWWRRRHRQPPSYQLLTTTFGPWDQVLASARRQRDHAPARTAPGH